MCAIVSLIVPAHFFAFFFSFLPFAKMDFLFLYSGRFVFGRWGEFSHFSTGKNSAGAKSRRESALDIPFFFFFLIQTVIK
jgi:hypothetical protein